MNTSDLLFCIEQTGNLLRKQFFHNAGENLQAVAGGMQKVLLEYTQKYKERPEETESILPVCMEVIGEVVDAMERQDYILCADLLETEVYTIAELICQKLDETETPIIWEEAESYYQLEKARSGDFTIKTKGDQGFYLHSRVNPRIEAKTWIDNILEIGKEAYIVFGIGLGYHIEAIYNKVSGRSEIEVYEMDKEMIALSYEYGRMDKVNAENMQVWHDVDGSLFAKAVNGRDVQIIMHYPSVKKIKNQNIGTSFKKFFISDSSVKEVTELMFMNYKSNTKLCTRNADELLGEIKGKKVIIVAAGPSLDKNVHLLKKEDRDFLIIAVGTVFGKLVRMGIYPDYVAFMDAQERTFRQMEEILPFNLQIPIIVESTACWRFIKEYQGPSYIAYQKGYELAEKAAEKENRILFETGGTVTSLALDVAIKGKADTIITVGLDLAYTNGVSHAEGTPGYQRAEEYEIVEVPGYYGGKVTTEMTLNLYREWIEKRIMNCDKAITFVNATEGGVFIKGMRHEELKKWI